MISNFSSSFLSVLCLPWLECNNLPLIELGRFSFWERGNLEKVDQWLHDFSKCQCQLSVPAIPLRTLATEKLATCRR